MRRQRVEIAEQPCDASAKQVQPLTKLGRGDTVDFPFWMNVILVAIVAQLLKVLLGTISSIKRIASIKYGEPVEHLGL